jgi:signal transduction histidine kinase
MSERVRHFGGHMDIESNHQGTKILFRFPLSKEASLVQQSLGQQEGQERLAQQIQVIG